MPNKSPLYIHVADSTGRYIEWSKSHGFNGDIRLVSISEIRCEHRVYLPWEGRNYMASKDYALGALVAMVFKLDNPTISYEGTLLTNGIIVPAVGPWH